MTIKKSLVFGMLVLVTLLGFGPEVIAQQSSSFKVAGPCVKCGSERLVKLVQGMDGVSKAKYDASSFMLSVQYNSELASELDIQLELSLNGYDAGDFQHDASAKLPPCASGPDSRGAAAELGDLSLNDLDGVEDPANWESSKNLSELEKLGRKGDDDAEISDEALFTEEVDDDEEELMNWEPIDLESTDDGNP